MPPRHLTCRSGPCRLFEESALDPLDFLSLSLTIVRSASRISLDIWAHAVSLSLMSVASPRLELSHELADPQGAVYDVFVWKVTVAASRDQLMGLGRQSHFLETLHPPDSRRAAPAWALPARNVPVKADYRS